MLPLPQAKWQPLPEGDVAGKDLQVGIDRRSSLAFKGAGSETA